MSRPVKQTMAADMATVAGDLRVVLGQLTRRLRGQSDLGDLTRSQRSVLSRLEREGPATMTALAKAEGIRPQSMGAVIRVLESAGLIDRSPDPSDGRKSVLSVSAAAREHFATGRLAREDWLFRAIRTQLSLTEQEQLASSVDLLKRLANAPLRRLTGAGSAAGRSRRCRCSARRRRP